MEKPEDPNRMVITSLQPVNSDKDSIMQNRGEVPTQYQVKEGDSLWTITKNVYQLENPIKIINLIGQLIDMNNDIIDPDLIFVGQTIKLS